MTEVSFVVCLFQGPKSDPKDDYGDAPETEKDLETKEVTVKNTLDVLNKQAEQNSHGMAAL